MGIAIGIVAIDGADGVEAGYDFGGEVDGCGLQIFAQVVGGRGSGDEQDVGGTMQQPGEGDLQGGSVDRGCCLIEFCGLQGGEAAEGEEGDVGDAAFCEVVDEGVVASVGEVVEILHADNFGDFGGFGELVGGDVADSDVADEALFFELDEGGEWLFDGELGWTGGAADAEIDDIEGIYCQVAQVIVGALGQALGGEVGEPGFVLAAPGAELGDQDEILGVGVDGFAEDLVGDVGAVEVAGVDVVDAVFDGFANDAEGFGAVAGRAKDAGTGELHGSIAHAVDGEGGVREGEVAAKQI